MSDTTTLHFCGGAGTVTGSNFLLVPSNAEGLHILVDCGLTQGTDTAEARNWEAFPYDPATIQVLLVTHAHIDHIGRIPKLVKEGFRGRIISTEATRALAEPLLLDSSELLLNEAEKHGLPKLYTSADVAAAMKLWEEVPYHKKIELQGGITAEFLDSGHILGSGMVRFERAGKKIVFTGDLGGGNSPLLKDPEDIEGTQYLVMESVYGDRVRNEDDNRREQLEDVIEDTIGKGGTLLVPAFSTERTQDLLFEIRSLILEKRVPSCPVYIDSPLAQKITAAYLAHPSYFSSDIQERVLKGEKIFSFPELQLVEDTEESRKVASQPGPKIVIAGSGMMSGGRVFMHEEHIFNDSRSTILIVGYQAAGTTGRRLIEGEKSLFIRGKKTPILCNVKVIYGYSAHMDGEQLLEFVNKNETSLKEVFVVMGEPSSATFLAQRIRDYLGTKATTPEAGEKVEIDF